MTKPTVFISYSHKDELWKNRLEAHLGVLARENDFCTWSDREIWAGDDLNEEIRQAMNRAVIGIMLISADFLTSDFILNTEVTTLMRRRAEEGLRIVPVIVWDCPWKEVDWLSSMQCRPKDGKALSSFSKSKYQKHLSDIAREVAQLLGGAKKLLVGEKAEWKLPPENISLSRLPSTGADLFGRDDELELLDDAWSDEKTNVITLVAFGGVGKSALVNSWLTRMGEDSYRGARRVDGWSFYSQGTSEDREASGDEFLAHALTEWFGEKDVPKSPWVRGERLANLCRQSRTLLILDGLEPLQYPPGEQTGKVRDAGVQSLLRELAVDNAGLCVVTTRVAVDDLKDFEKSSVQRIELKDLSGGRATSCQSWGQRRFR